MAYETFETYNMRQGSLDTLEFADGIIREYKRDHDLSLTLRQLHYVFVSRNLYENTQQNYKNLGALITKGRRAGLIDWDGIHDEGRSARRVFGPQTPYSLLRFIEDRLIVDPWQDQDNYVEVWIEKHGMAGTISSVCNKHRVTYLTCGGYLSSSEAYSGGKRFAHAAERGKNCILIHLGDHDPSGLDMTRDNGQRANEYGGFMDGVEIRRIALNYDQVEQYNPPPNPAKMTDTRADEYIAEHGDSSWELDALPPNIIRDILDDAVNDCIADPDAWNESFQTEEERKKHLSQLAGDWDNITRFLDALGVDDEATMESVNNVLAEF